MKSNNNNRNNNDNSLPQRPSDGVGHIDLESTKRTPRPSNWQHAKILMHRNLVKDMKKPALWAAKTILAPALFMLYTIGFFMASRGYSNDGVVNVGDYQLFPGENWTFPQSMWIGGWSLEYTQQIGASVESVLANATTTDGVAVNVTTTSMSNLTEFTTACQEAMPSTAAEGVCVYFNATDTYNIYFGGQEFAVPFQPALAAAQQVVNEAIVQLAAGNDGTTFSSSYPVDWIQRTPRLLNESTVDVPVALLLVPAILYVLSITIGLQFIIGPVVYEKINYVRDAYELVGVYLRTYLLQWNIYYGLNGIITAGVMTIISIYWNVFPLSNPALIFFSHILGLWHLNALFILYMQVQEQEEAAQGKPWIVAILSMAIGSVLLVFSEPTNVAFYILSVFFPFVGIMQYFGIYITYDAVGFDTGIHLRDNVFSSGLFGSYMAQLVGLVLYMTLTCLYSSQSFNDWLTNNHKAEGVQDTTLEEERSDSSGRFEPLVPGAEIVMSVRGLEQTYMPPRFSCDRAQEPTTVLKGLDLDVCRGEVFGYLGHNGSGKTSSINIMTGQLKMQHGDIRYHFRDGSRNLQDSSDKHAIRTNIGVCPQHNTALQNDMTAREFLRLIAHLKGGTDVAPGQSTNEAVEAEVQARLDDISFTSNEDADKIIDTYSGGMKRKVLIAMALIGNPDLVFLDEPTAGLDPYNRRAIWDIIIAAKQKCSILLTTHYLEEADLLSDRIGILKDGKLITCGTSLFLKHHFGAGYTLKFEADQSIDVASVVPNAKDVSSDNQREFNWRLGHGTEENFPGLLETLVAKGGRDVQVDLTTLEDVFLETGKEDPLEASTEVGSNASDSEGFEHAHDPESPETQYDRLARIWEPRAPKQDVTFWSKLQMVTHFMTTNALKSKGEIFLNITMPLIYLIAGVVLATVVDTQKEGQLIVQSPIMLAPSLSGEGPFAFFGVPEDANSIAPLFPVEATPESPDDYFNSIPVLGGYFSENATLQHAPEVSPFALQIGVGVLSNYTVWELGTDTLNGITTAVQQLPYLSTAPFRIDLLFIPYCLVFGFAGLAFSVLDVLLLKGNKTIELFRVAGITEWTTYLGAITYKFCTTFLPFFILLLVLGFSLALALFGSGGRWLGTILICLAFAFSSSPQGLILAKRFIHSDFKSVSNWFPGVYFTVAGLPYILYSVLLQTLPNAEQQILILGDVLSIVPQVAFQRAIGAVLGVSSEYDDPELGWGDVWAFETRLWYCILMMTVIGAVEWWYLFWLTTRREPQTKLKGEDENLTHPISVEEDALIAKERERSFVDDQGINARDLVKVFEIKDGKRTKSKKFKRAVKGISMGIRKNEIFVLLGPNGAGKTVTMSMLASAITPEHGDIALDGVVAAQSDRNTDKLYAGGNVSYCAQFDALFENKTVIQHFQFFCKIRGLRWDNKLTQEHIDTIIKLLSLEKHRLKTAEELSGGYKRRLCLGLSMVGYPSCCALDEPTTGLDPGARRLVWDVLKPEGIEVPAIFLSSHYMDEASSLGTRIGIMVDGQFVSTGSLNELYDHYCTSFFVEISFDTDANDAQTDEMVVREFENAAMPASVYESLPYHVKLQVDIKDSTAERDTLQLAAIFKLLESKKRELHIKFYSVTKMNLEQIFINLSRKQFEADEEAE